MIKLLENPRQEIDPVFKALFDGLPIDEFSVRNPHDWRGEKGEIKMADNGKKYYPCLVFWSAMSIAWDGRVVGCSADLNGRVILGDVCKQSIMEIWNSEPMRRHRRLLRQKRYPELDLCADCHTLWHDGHPMISILFQIPPFEQIRSGLRWLYPPSHRRDVTTRSEGAIRSRE